ncbi:MAG: hypothetical protein H6709_22710 [Kofleriaceae bacterium]|nr:hypothetical protein [Myxococcales bacterium]MCB9559214.1 hypothetical protein [Kofleriaceae bacterium]MCB9574894.1 hypothetical protein [Kofleriaceae bacterium]
MTSLPRAVRRLVGPSLAAFLLTACGSKPPAPAAPTALAPAEADFVAKVEAIQQRICQCKDPACNVEAWQAVTELLKADASQIALGDGGAARTGRAFLAGLQCGQAQEAAKRDATSRALTELTELRDRACACTDVACADAIDTSFEAFMKRHQDTTGDEDSVQLAGRLAGEMMGCLATVRGQPWPPPGDGDDDAKPPLED